jgi:glucose/arabinose dehydrogenase
MHLARHRSTMALLAALALATGSACGDDDGGGSDGADDGSDGADGADGTDDGTDDDGGDDGTPDAGPSVSECKPQKGTNLALELVAQDPARFDEPVLVTSPPDDPRLFVVSKHGAISIIKGGRVLKEPFLDIAERVDSGRAPNEQGLLGLAFHPDYAKNGRFYVFYTRLDGSEQDPSPDRVSEFRVSKGNPDVADPESEREILELEDLESNHNGGMLAFGRDDGYLYIGMGDGGSGGDPDGNGQDKSTLLGDILRIDINSTKTPYAIPPDNPYVGAGGDPAPADEIFISGLRNPWRWSFDRNTGDMYIGDVGQNAWEEIHVLPAGQQAGANLGWNTMEGNECFPPEKKDCNRDGLVLPVDTYVNNGGEAVVGGYVYRGACFPDIQGWYFYGDYANENIVKFVFADGQASEKEDVTEDIDPDSIIQGLSSFGEDAYGELYVVSLGGGAIYRIVAGP